MLNALSRRFYTFVFRIGVRAGLVLPYEQGLIDRLRAVYFGGLPGSVILLIRQLCDGKCYDRAMMISMGMDKFEMVWGSIRNIRLDGGKDGRPIIETSDHCWVECGDWVYDTSHCLRTKKWFYYFLESPIIRLREDQDWFRDQLIYQEWLSCNPETNRRLLPAIIPLIEPLIPGCLYKETVEYELDLFKIKINYNQIHEEIEADLKAMGIK